MPASAWPRMHAGCSKNTNLIKFFINVIIFISISQVKIIYLELSKPEIVIAI
jgi:hypothetical protein